MLPAVFHPNFPSHSHLQRWNGHQCRATRAPSSWRNLDHYATNATRPTDRSWECSAPPSNARPPAVASRVELPPVPTDARKNRRYLSTYSPGPDRGRHPHSDDARGAPAAAACVVLLFHPLIRPQPRARMCNVGRRMAGPVRARHWEPSVPGSRWTGESPLSALQATSSRRVGRCSVRWVSKVG